MYAFYKRESIVVCDKIVTESVKNLALLVNKGVKQPLGGFFERLSLREPSSTF